MKERVSIYARESSDDTNKAPPITEQINRARQYAQEKDYEVVEVYEDNGYSGGDWKRPAFNRLKEDAKRHLFTLVIVWSQDRIARDTEQFLNFYRTLKDAHVKLYSITENEINMENVGDRVKHTSLAQASEIFRLITSEKVKKAYSSKKKLAESKGERIQWGRKPKELDIDAIMRYRRQGMGYRQIRDMIGGISYQTIRRLLQKHLPSNSDIAQRKTSKRKDKSKELQNNPI